MASSTDRVHAEVMCRGRVEVVARRRAVEHVGLEHRVVTDAGELDAVVAQHVCVELEMMPRLGTRGILEQRFQGRERPRAIELRGCAGVVVRERHVGGVPGLDAERNAHDLGTHVVERRRARVDREERRPTQPLEPSLERCIGDDGLVAPRDRIATRAGRRCAGRCCVRA
jgi:hypothetical protein